MNSVTTADAMLAVAAGGLFTFAASYIPTGAGQKALMEASTPLELSPVNLFGLWMAGLILVALVAKLSSPPWLCFLEKCFAFCISMASLSLVRILLRDVHHCSWITYTPLVVLFYLLSSKLAQFLGLDHLALTVVAALTLAKIRLVMFWKNFAQRLGLGLGLGNSTNLDNQLAVGAGSGDDMV